MKIRSGFVSNSSSSSFVVITTKKNLDNIISQSTDEMKRFITEEITDRRGSSFCNPMKIHGMDCVDLSRVLHDGQFDYWGDDSQDPTTGGYKTSGSELWQDLMDKIKASGGYVNEEGC